MNYQKTCHHCGHRVTAYTLHLNEPLVRALVAFADARLRIGRPVGKGGIGLTNAQYSNFQNLRHFGFVIQEETGRAWEMTPAGWSFLRGESTVTTPAGHFGGITLAPDHEAWGSHDGRRSEVYIRDILAEGWTDRREFQLEKRGAA